MCLYVYTQWNAQPEKKKWDFAICNNMDGLEGIMLSGISQRNKNTAYYHVYMQSKKHNKLVNVTKKREFEWIPGDGDEQGGLVCCDS